jgi:putative cardiolipin synthase
VGRLWNFIADFDRVNHRMHNKIMVMDNAVAIVGGRNIGDHYFGVNTKANYRDLDIIAVGPVVREASAVFDRFWNGDWAVSIEMLVDRPYTEADLHTTLATLHETIAADHYPYPLDQDVAELREQLRAERQNLIWAPAHVVYDDPESIGADVGEGAVRDALFRKMANIEKEILIESAYFVPGERGVAAAKDIHARGVRIRVLTNSLVSNDVIPAHAGHSKYRRQLVENGVELYELRPDTGVLKQSLISSESKAALHTKAVVFDRESVFIGSYNLDRRSANINTEAGIYVESPEFAARVANFLDEGVEPENSYRVMIDEESGQLYWLTETDGQKVRYNKDPKSSFWQRFIVGFIRMLPVESQL